LFRVLDVNIYKLIILIENMGFKDLLKDKLNEKVDKDKLELLPSGFQRIGDIIIVNLKPELNEFKGDIGKMIIEIFSKIRSVCNKKGGIKGQLREPQVELIAGNKNTETTHTESNCFYRFDVRKIMFAKGNVIERSRIAKQIKSEEIIVDMFAGIGYFTIPIAKLSNPKKIYSIELNPVSYKYLKENIKLNHILDKVEVINGDCKEEVLKIEKKYGRIADRVILGYLPPPKEFLPFAMKIIKRKGILHYEGFVSVGNEKEDIEKNLEDVRKAAEKEGFKVKLLLARKVKAYAPKRDHYVFDIQIL
jgi:tRNA wybutosine-synthesizing protein 2